MATYYKDLLVWQKSMRLVQIVYQSTQSFPECERFGLAMQVRRAAVSIPSNIAEGQARKSSAEFAHFLTIAQGSLAEVETQMIIACELGYLTSSAFNDFADLHSEVSRMLSALWSKIATNSDSTRN